MGLFVDIPTKFLSLLKNLFVDIPKPRAWPPPPLEDTQRVTELLEYGAKRDPVGDRVHTWFACLFLFCLPLATAPAGISMGILFVHSLLRLPTTWRTLTPLLKSSVYWSILAWVLYSTLSIAWSSDIPMGLDHAGSMWWPAAIPALLWPVLRRWKWFVAAGLAGVFLQNMCQVSELVGSLFLDGKDWRTGNKLSADGYIGFDQHQGNGALFLAFAGIIWISIIFLTRKYTRVAFVGLGFVLFGIIVAKSRSVWVGFGLATIVFTLLSIYYKLLLNRRNAIVVASLFVITILTAASLSSSFKNHVLDIQSSAESYFSEGEINTGNQMRLHWAATLIQKSFDFPMGVHTAVGHGLGSTRTVDFSVEGQDVEKTTAHPHNSYVQILYEGGLIGLLLFIFMLKKIAIPKNFRLLKSPIAIAGFSCVALWAIATFFEGGQNSGRVIALLLICASFSLIPLNKECSERV